MAYKNRLGGHTNSYHTYSLEEALEGIAAAGYRFVELTAKRYFDGKTLETWVIPATEWKTIRGVEMPVRGGAVWKLAAGDFDYYRWEIVDVEANNPTLWGEDGGQ